MELTTTQLKNIFVAIAKESEPDFIIDDNNRSEILNLFNYFTDSKDFTLDKSKGILLIGEIGTGKTMIMKTFSKFTNQLNLKSAFEFTPINLIHDKVSRLGHNAIELFTWKRYDNGTGTPQIEMNDICIDDLGTERNIKHYGDDVDYIEEIIQTRYDLQKNYSIRTHATTNLSLDDIEKKYANRTTDRMREMFNIVFLHGKSRRK